MAMLPGSAGPYASVMSSTHDEYPTLDEFLAAPPTQPGHEEYEYRVQEPGFEGLCVEVADVEVHGVVYAPTLIIKNVHVEEDRQHSGLFTNLLLRLRRQYPLLHILILAVVPERFDNYLRAAGFESLRPGRPQNHFLRAGAPLRLSPRGPAA